MLPLDVVIVPPMFTAAAPVSVKDPEREILPGAVVVRTPPLLRVKMRGPPPVVVIAPPRTTFDVAREIPPTPVVMTPPLNVVVPVPALCVREAPEKLPLAVTRKAQFIVMFPTGEKQPKAPTKKKTPAPAVNW